MTKYIISGYIGFDNFGDEAVAKVLIQKLKTLDAEKITLISHNPQKSSVLYGVDACPFFNFLIPLIKSDVLISGGGSLLQDVTSLRSLLYYLSVIYTAYIFHKKVEIFAQGIGPISSSLGKFLVKLALKNASKISVRDKKSYELLSDWGINAELVKDPVFSMEISPKNKTGIVGVQLRNCANMNKNFIRELARSVAEKFSHKEIHVISLQDSIDLDVCNEFSEMLRQYGAESKVLSDLDTNSVIEAISDLEYLIAMRFHANVIGILSKVKTIAINYDPKVEKLAEEYNLPLIDLNQENFSVQFEKLD